jgi:hypothetical protein
LAHLVGDRLVTTEAMVAELPKKKGRRPLQARAWATWTIDGATPGRAARSADRWPDHVAVPTFGPCMVCTRCGIVGAETARLETPAKRGFW